jgi:hypothetical protein
MLRSSQSLYYVFYDQVANESTLAAVNRDELTSLGGQIVDTIYIVSPERRTNAQQEQTKSSKLGFED